MATWKKVETRTGMPYYIMHSSRKTQWDHPKFQEIQKGLKECNIIKYASYRTAAKIAMLNRALYMHHIRLGLIAGVFERHGFKSMENKIVLECSELEAILFDVFFAAQKETSCQFDVGLVTELMINLLFNIYDREKYQYMFGQLADHNRCISRKKLENLLRNFTQIAEYLSEACAFGSDLVPEAVDICFQQSQGTLGVTEDIFITWLLHEPQLLHWLPTFHRMKAAEKVIHDVKCRTCKMYPLTGLRYQCLQCLKYNQCQSCFFMCKTSRRHKLKHLMQEYWSEEYWSEVCSTNTSFRSTGVRYVLQSNLLLYKHLVHEYFIEPADDEIEARIPAGSIEGVS
ncbi:unnamed protein product [Timema podura]|uniref:Dystrophin n=1 Tax=Timema podura TaxID=61482 RepID=A0ABN7NXF2_TIMPD|nr:unnamed protein product [Timema podura]